MHLPITDSRRYESPLRSFLSREGFSVGIRETLDSLRVADWCGVLDEPLLRQGLPVCCVSRAATGTADRLFERFWYPQRLEQSLAQQVKRDPRIIRWDHTSGVTGRKVIPAASDA
ncbi:MAG: hypothetical protein R3F37_20345 [Candidatus Competibacteraceae bacterium]